MIEMSLTSSQRILLVLALVMLLWYVIGLWYSRRKGIRTLNWLHEGVQALGGQVHADWFGSAASGARVVVIKADPPFRQLEITYLLESRELLPVWLMNLLRGKRDELTLKAHLRSPRQGAIEVAPSRNRLEQLLRQNGRTSWHWQEGPHGLHIAYRGGQGKTLSAAVLPFLQSYGPYLNRFSLERKQPQLLLQLRLAGLTDRQSADFFKDLIAVFAPHDL
jgi:hypothetical protein